MVMLSAQLRDALQNYSKVAVNVATVGERRDYERKQALVSWRRQLADQGGRLGPAIDRDEELAKDPEMQRELSRLFAAMRYALAVHQAEWPAVTIDDDPDAYRASAMRVREKSTAFWAWCKDHLNYHRDRVAG